VSYRCSRRADGETECTTLRGSVLDVGMNVPWIRCAWDFGDPPLDWVADSDVDDRRRRVRRDWDRKLGALREAGVGVVRFWVLGSGHNYPARSDVTPRFDDGVVSPSVIAPLSRAFIDDFQHVLSLMARHGLKALPSLLSFEWGFPGVARQRRVVGGRGGWLEDDGARRAFLDAVLEPLLQVGHHDTIFAWEVMNEPEWCSRGWRPTNSPSDRATVDQAHMEAFLQEALDRIASAGFVGSVGFAHRQVPGKRQLTTGFVRYLQHLAATAPRGATFGYLHQFHHYPRTRALPPAHDHPAHHGLPVAVGEFPSAPAWKRPPHRVHGAWRVFREHLKELADKGIPTNWRALGEARGPAPWIARDWNPDPELDAERYLLSRLTTLQLRGYRHAFLWSAQDPISLDVEGQTYRFRRDTSSEWASLQRRQVRVFAHQMAVLRGT